MARGRRYPIESQNPIASPSKTAGNLSATSAVRPWIYDLDFGYSATPADNALAFYLQRFTAPGTSTAYVPAPLDPGDPACTAVAGVTNSVEPTYTAAKVLWHSASNQRATHRFNFDPDGPLICPATASNGIGWFGVHASFTGNLDALVYFAE